MCIVDIKLLWQQLEEHVDGLEGGESGGRKGGYEEVLRIQVKVGRDLHGGGHSEEGQQAMGRAAEREGLLCRVRKLGREGRLQGFGWRVWVLMVMFAEAWTEEVEPVE